MGGEGVAFDREAMLAELDGDEDLLAELVDTMKAEAPKLLHEVRVAADAADAALVARAAHTLKGAVSNFGARAAADAALRLEKMGRTADLTDLAAALATLEAEMAVLVRELEAA
ncbi:MAG: Hpt domain-containing protein [Deltaproteobacteria bacterium]|nr:Hpt domain-containing protein [Deltaproteobacteria bacterium]